MAGQLATLVIFLLVPSLTWSEPYLSYKLYNPHTNSFVIIRCCHENIWKYGTFCVKIFSQNTTTPPPSSSSSTPVPPPPGENPAPPAEPSIPPQEPGPEPSTPPEEPAPEPPTPPQEPAPEPPTPPQDPAPEPPEEPPEPPQESSDVSATEESSTAFPMEPLILSLGGSTSGGQPRLGLINRLPRNLHFGPEFSVSLPSLKPPLSFFLPYRRPGDLPASQSPTIIVQAPSTIHPQPPTW